MPAESRTIPPSPTQFRPKRYLGVTLWSLARNKAQPFLAKPLF